MQCMAPLPTGRANFVPVNFAGTKVSFNSKNGAAATLAKVGEKLSLALARDPGLRAFLFPLGGTYNRRSIAGTNRLSAHSHGIAIDLHKGKYWRWGKTLNPMEILALQSEYPWEIVAAFEEQGFIWGGKWYHYDSMHFEYRPELLAKARLVAAPNRAAPKIMHPKIKRRESKAPPALGSNLIPHCDYKI